ncbi:hypothetical protein PENTCL1PPCAC_6698 [Pristionchus entomophagus]|uniref:Uncharacterized protein n=1 Tax=Pristionchus entomophagus TaxID=358040 RepID=A0AAV5SV67_9BILA|nr:hypothetical protein PENTCL1PPCAC_6698 [Pristionchus entomophagus]
MGKWMRIASFPILFLIPLSVASPALYKLVFDEVETIGGGNFSRHEILTNASFRIISVPLEGDIDLYLSYSTKNVSFDLADHNASSSTCGIDYLDVPSISPFHPRPTYLAIFGHPFHETSKYRLIVVKKVEEDGEDGILEYEWEDSPIELIEMIDEGRGKGGEGSLIAAFFTHHLWNILEIIFTILLEF